MRAIVLVLAILAAVSVPRRAAAEVVVTVRQPASGARVGNALTVQVDVVSGFDVTVTARVGTRTQSLPRTGGCTPSGCSTFRANLDLRGQTQGAQTLFVDVSDSSGDSEHLEVPFVYDAPPVVSVTEPLDYTVTRQNIRVRGTCTDSGGPCTQVTFGGSSGAPFRTLQGVSAFDETFDLSAVWQPDTHSFVVTGVDDNGNQTRRGTAVIFEPSPRLVELYAAAGLVHDGDRGRILTGVSNRLDLVDRRSGATTVLYRGALSMARLTPRGAVLVATIAGATRLVEVSDGVVTDRGPAHAATFQLTADGVVSWHSGTFEYRVLDVTTGALTVLPDVVNAIGSSGGVIVYRRRADNALIRRVGAVDTQIRAASPSNFAYETDGDIVAVAATQCRLELILPGGGTELVFDAPGCGSTSITVLFNGGWMAYTRPNTAGVPQVWVREPDGDKTQLTGMPLGPVLQALAEDGEVMINHGSRYDVRIGEAPTRIGLPQGRVFRADGYWFEQLGRHLFAIDIVPPLPGDGGDPDAGVPDAGAPVDAGVDAPVDASADAAPPPVDAGVDAPVDAGVDAPVDAGVDAPADAAVDAVTDAAVDAPTDPVADAGAPADAAPDQPDAAAAADAAPGPDAFPGPDAGGDVDDDDGCGCASSGNGGAPWLLVLGALLLRRRRR